MSMAIQSINMESVICIIGAVKEEIVAIQRAMTVEDTLHTRSGSFWTGIFSGRRVVLVRSGVGKTCAREALTRVCERFAPSLIISMGYAGSVVPHLNIGDLIVADKVLEFMHDGAADWTLKRETLEIPLDTFPVGNAFGVLRGGLLTVDEVICKPEQKRALGKNHQVLAVEMETSALARMAREKKLPFVSVRVISDTVDHELPDFSTMQDEKGEVSKLKAGWHVLTHPNALKSMIELRENTRKATARLTGFLAQFITNVA